MSTVDEGGGGGSKNHCGAKTIELNQNRKRKLLKFHILQVIGWRGVPSPGIGIDWEGSF